MLRMYRPVFMYIDILQHYQRHIALSTPVQGNAVPRYSPDKFGIADYPGVPVRPGCPGSPGNEINENYFRTKLRSSIAKCILAYSCSQMFTLANISRIFHPQ